MSFWTERKSSTPSYRGSRIRWHNGKVRRTRSKTVRELGAHVGVEVC